MTLMPWLSVPDATAAVAFYEQAFGADVRERFDPDGRIEVAELAVGDASFWVARDPDSSPEALGGRSAARLILLDDPDAALARALAAAAREVAAVHEEQSWRVGGLVDPSGHHWELGRRL